MVTVPNTLEDATAQARAATQLALESGVRRLQIELVVPEIALKAQSLALSFTHLLERHGEGLKVLFPDTGAAALARRDWGETTFQVGDLGGRFTPIEMKIAPEDEAFLVVAPSAVEVQTVETLCNLAGERPVVLLIPQLEDVSVVGIGLAARKLRERFLSTLESAYYFRPVEGAVVLRSFPEPWTVWFEEEGDYRCIAEEAQKPMGEGLEQIIMKAITSGEGKTGDSPPPIKKPGVLASMQRFIKALSQ
jgi:hypothetical protein